MRRHGILWEWESRRSKRFDYSLNERKGAVRMLRSNGMVDVVDRCIGWMSASLRTRAWWWCIWWIWTVCLFLFYGGGGEEDDRPVDARTGCIQKKREVRLLQRSRVEMKLNWTTFGQPQQPVGGRTRNGIHLMLFEKQTYNTERRVLKRRTMLREPRQDNMPARCCCSRCSSAVCLRWWWSTSSCTSTWVSLGLVGFFYWSNLVAMISRW